MLHKIVGSTTAAPHIQIIFLRAYDLFGGGGERVLENVCLLYGRLHRI